MQLLFEDQARITLSANGPFQGRDAGLERRVPIGSLRRTGRFSRRRCLPGHPGSHCEACGKTGDDRN